MRRTLTALALGTLMLVPPLFVPAAEAAHGDWVFGARFRVGDALFNIGFVPASYDPYRPVYYYRTNEPLRYRGHRCHDRCYHRSGYSYHYATCPVVQRHFRHFGLHPRTVFSRYAPRYDRYDDRRYDDRYYDRRHDDRYYDRRYDDRYDRRGRYDRGRYERRHRGHYDRRDHRGHRHRNGRCDYGDYDHDSDSY